MFHVETMAHVWRLVMGVTIIALSVVTAALLLLYPREEWVWEISVSWPLTIFLSSTTTYLIGQQMLKVHQLNEELRRVVSRDRLTDVATRDYFFERMDENPDAYGVSLMVDIDYFKDINDRYGHLTGDRAIAKVAQVITSEIRSDDIVCRFGGEEFVIFIAEADHDHGAYVAERLRKVIARTPVPGEHGFLSVTVSIGGSLKDATENIEAAIQRADEALYKAKALGRNRALMFPVADAPPQSAIA